MVIIQLEINVCQFFKEWYYMQISSFFSRALFVVVLGFVSVTSVIAAPPAGNSALQFAFGQICKRTTPISTITDNLTMQCWVKWNGGGVGTIFYNGNGSFNGYGLCVNGSNQIGLLCGGITNPFSTTTLALNTWQHLALVRNAGTWSLYVNGVVTTLASVSNPNVPAAPLDAVLSFNGLVDEVSFFNTALSPATILAYKDQPISASHPNFANLVAYYQLNEGTGQTAGSGTSLDMQLGSTAGVDVDDPTWVVSDVPLVPTLGEWGMIALTGILLYAGYHYISRRKTSATIA